MTGKLVEGYADYITVPWSSLAPSRRYPSGEDLPELGLVGWLARDLVVPAPALDPVEDHREIASPQVGFHVERRVYQAAEHCQDDLDVALSYIRAQTARRLGSLDELTDERLDPLPGAPPQLGTVGASEHKLPQPAVRGLQLEVSLHELAQPQPRVLYLKSLFDDPDDGVYPIMEQLVEEPIPRWEATVDGADPNIGFPSYLLIAHAQPALGDQLAGSGEDPPTVALGVAAQGRSVARRRDL